MTEAELGTATVTPAKPVVAGAWCSLLFRYRCGHPMDETGSLKIAFRFASDCGEPQFDRPDQPNYCSVTTTGHCRVEPRWDLKGHIRPWDRALFLKIMGGYLDRDEEILVRFGDRRFGSPGWRCKRFARGRSSSRRW